MKALTETQTKAVRTINRLTVLMGYPPTLREVAKAMGLSTTRVHQILQDLKKRRHVTWSANRARTIVVL